MQLQYVLSTGHIQFSQHFSGCDEEAETLQDTKLEGGVGARLQRSARDGWQFAGPQDPALSSEASFFQGVGPRPAEVYTKKGPDTWPWQARIFLDNRHRCEGALISRDRVLTSANCFGRWVQGLVRVMDSWSRWRPSASPPPLHPRLCTAGLSLIST